MSSMQDSVSLQNILTINSEKKNYKVLKIFHSSICAWIILLISLALTATAYIVSNYLVTQRLEEKFRFRANEITHAIKGRLNIYEQVLWGGVGFMNASDKNIISRQQWATYVKAIDINQHWPGIQGMGFSIPIRPEEKRNHINTIKAEGFSQYTIKPSGERPIYSTIIYLEPFNWRNKRALGYDMWSNDTRRLAMTRARDEGVAATSGIITLVQETDRDIQKGFLMYVPVYENNTLSDTVDSRRDHFIGWVYAPFRAGDLMKGIIGSDDPNIEFEIFDGKQIKKTNLLFDSNNTLHTDHNETQEFKKITSITLQGRIWTLAFTTPSDRLDTTSDNVPHFVAIAGICIDLLLFYVIYSLHFINKRAERMAKDITSELEKTNTSLETVVRKRTEELQHARNELEGRVKKRTLDLESKINELEILNKVTMGRESRLLELKQDINNLTKELGRTPPYKIEA